MKANTAIAIFLTAFAIAVLLRPTRSRRLIWIARLSAGLTALLGLLSMWEYISGCDLAIDQFILSDFAGENFAGRMAFNSAVCFVALGVSAILFSRRRIDRLTLVGQSLCVVTLATVNCSLIGYGMHVGFLRSFVMTNPMSIHACVAITALVVGLLMTQGNTGLMRLVYSRGPGGIAFRRLVPALVVLLPSTHSLLLVGHNAGWYPIQSGAAVGIAINVTAVALAITWVAWSLDGLHRAATARQQEDNQILESRVAERTAELSESRERFRIFMDNGPVVAWAKDETGHFTYANEKLGRMLAMAQSDVVGKHDCELLSGEALAEVSAHDRLVFETGKSQEFEETCADGNGVMRDWLVYKFPLPTEDGRRLCGAMAMDITERKLLNARNRASDLKLRAIYDSSFQLVGLLDPTGIVLEANTTALGFIGMQLSMVQGTLFWETPWWNHSDVEQAKCRDAVEKAARGDTVRLYTQHTCKPDGIIDIDFSLKPMRDEAGKLTHLIFEGRDVTELKQAQREAAHAKEAADGANQAKSEFLANMSHEIRTPIAAIIGFSDLLATPNQSSSDRDQYISTVRRNAKNLLELINDILDLSKIESGKMSLERTTFELPQFLADIMSTLRPRANEKALRLGLKFEGKIPQKIQTDVLRLRQILVNLIGNAVKFTEYGGVTLRVCLAEPQDCRSLKFTIEDTGIGLSAEQLSRLFQPFTQADESTTRRFGGTGLGLTISRRLARLLGGDIRVSSTPGVGSSFVATIEYGAAPECLMLEGLTESELPLNAIPLTHSNLQLHCRILLAEDGRDNQRLLTTHLRAAGAEVAVAENGRIAVSMASTQPFDIILMDMQMPEMDGYSATAELRRRGFSLPIIALTAHAMSEDREKCLNSGCSDYLTKPVYQETLLRTIAKHLAHEAAGATPVQAETRPAKADDKAGTILSTMTDFPEMKKIIDEYVEGLPDEVRKLQGFLDGNDLQQLRRVVHQLRGTGGGYGFDLISDTAEEAENSIRADDAFEKIAMKVNSLIEVIHRVNGFDKESVIVDRSTRQEPS